MVPELPRPGPGTTPNPRQVNTIQGQADGGVIYGSLQPALLQKVRRTRDDICSSCSCRTKTSPAFDSRYGLSLTLTLATTSTSGTGQARPTYVSIGLLRNSRSGNLSLLSTYKISHLYTINKQSSRSFSSPPSPSSISLLFSCNCRNPILVSHSEDEPQPPSSHGPPLPYAQTLILCSSLSPGTNACDGVCMSHMCPRDLHEVSLHHAIMSTPWTDVPAAFSTGSTKHICQTSAKCACSIGQNGRDAGEFCRSHSNGHPFSYPHCCFGMKETGSRMQECTSRSYSCALQAPVPQFSIHVPCTRPRNALVPPPMTLETQPR